MKRRAARRKPLPEATTATPSTATSRASAEPRNPLLQLQRTVGNAVVQRRVEALKGPDAESGSGEIVDSRLNLVRVESVEGKPTLKERKVTYKEQKSAVNTGLGATQSILNIEYSVDDTGQVHVGAIRPEYIITIYTPYVGSEDFVRKFGPIMELLWDKHGGDINAFSQSSEVRGFNYEPQTRRHEEMHVASRQLALRDIIPRYLRYMSGSGFFNAGVGTFTHQTNFYLKTAWDERVDEIVSHEQIYFIDAMAMVEEYRQRASEEDAAESDPWSDFVSKFK